MANKFIIFLSVFCLCFFCDPSAAAPRYPCTSTGPGCITASDNSCLGLKDGVYQACEGCTFYHSCFAEIINAFRNCPYFNDGGINGRLIWNDASKRCEYESPTCKCNKLPEKANRELSILETLQSERELPMDIERELIEEVQSERELPDVDTERERIEQVIGAETFSCRTGPDCIDGTEGSCPDVDGDYQDCTSCAIYHSCSRGRVIPHRKCTIGLFWEATSLGKGHCTWRSITCKSCI